jgi:hypothetical protein
MRINCIHLFTNRRNGGDRTSKPQLNPKRIFASIITAFGWLLFLALWLFSYATNFSILQNIAILLVFIVVATMLQILLWVPWSMKQTD